MMQWQKLAFTVSVAIAIVIVIVVVVVVNVIIVVIVLAIVFNVFFQQSNSAFDFFQTNTK